MNKLAKVDSYLGPEMKSTGEAIGIARTLNEAMRKAFAASGMHVERGSAALLTIADADKPELFPIVSRLIQLGCKIVATEGTASALRTAGFSPRVVAKIGEEGPTVVDVIVRGEVQLVINTMSNIYEDPGDGNPVFKDGFEIRRAAVERRIPCLTSLDTATALLDVRLVAGDEALAADVADRAAGQWRARASRWLAALATSVAERHDPKGRAYYWIEEGQNEWEPHDRSDYQAVRDGYVSVTPLQPDLTGHEALSIVEELTSGIRIEHDLPQGWQRAGSQ